MSRSYRKTPIFGNTTARSEKYDKKQLNKRLRHMPLYKAQNPKKVESNWCWAKDGKGYSTQHNQWFSYTDEEWKKMMRK